MRARDAAGGGLPVHARPRPRVEEYAEKIEEWVHHSRGKVRADAPDSAVVRAVEHVADLVEERKVAWQ